MTIRANFSNSGLDIGQQKSNMTYLYGLSDFFTVMFQDTSVVNLMLEAESENASEVYSRFLQLTSTLSIEGIQTTCESTVKLVLLDSTSAVSGIPNAYKLPVDVQSTRFIANRAFLPTELLENNVDYRIEQQDDGSSIIQFASPLASYSLSSRLLSDGKTLQYGLWFVDAHIDERWISTYYGDLIGVDPQNSTDQFANFVYGLYFVYTNGPKLDMLNRGLNLALGIPIARETEQVLDVRTYLDTDQYMVICDHNQYVIPYGLIPTVAAGDTVTVGQVLAQWVEIKDYQHDGEWWVNLYIPESVIPAMPAGQKDRYATLGSHFDYMMRNYLKKHTFMVKVRVKTFQNVQRFQQLSEIIQRAKPAYTESIYVWSVETLTEQIDIEDPVGMVALGTQWEENYKVCISRLRRDNTDDPIIRGRPSFIRYNMDMKYRNAIGEDPYIDSHTDVLGADTYTGFVNTMAQFRANTDQERAWITAMIQRSGETYRGYRSKLGFHRGVVNLSSLDGVAISVANTSWGVPANMRIVPLYTTTIADINAKATATGQELPDSSQWWFEIFSTRAKSESINSMAINDGRSVYDPMAVINYYNTFFFRSSYIGYFGREFPDASFQTFAPQKSDVQPGDYLLCIRINPSVVGVYWITSLQTGQAPSCFPLNEIDPLVATYNMPISRGGALNGCPFYVIRGAGHLSYNNVNATINDAAIDAQTDSGSPSTSLPYTDKYNTTTVNINRSGTVLKHAVESL